VVVLYTSLGCVCDVADLDAEMTRWKDAHGMYEAHGEFGCWFEF